MAGSSDDIEHIRELGGYEDRQEVLDDAVRSLLRHNPELRTELAIAKYRDGAISRNRAAELAGLTSAGFSDLLQERGIGTSPSGLSEEDRSKRLDELE